MYRVVYQVQEIYEIKGKNFYDSLTLFACGEVSFEHTVGTLTIFSSILYVFEIQKYVGSDSTKTFTSQTAHTMNTESQ